MDRNDSFFDQFCWHSSIGIDTVCDGDKRFFSRVANSKKARINFIAAGDSLLVHKATQALWKISDDGKFIEPVYDDDILTEDISEDKT